MLKVSWAPEYVLPLPPAHRFPMSKYELLPQQLLHEGTLAAANFFTPERAGMADVLRVHDEQYVSRLQAQKLEPMEIRRIGFPITRALVEREWLITGGSIQCAQYALEFGVSMNIAGGTHHAHRGAGEGFCLFNDQAVAAAWLLENKMAQKIFFIDLDVHQGNGTAEIFANEDRVFTFSMHGINNFPYKKAKSSLDIGLNDGVQDSEYLYRLDSALETLAYQMKPDFIFYQSGVDILSTDKLGKLKVSRKGCADRDRRVMNFAKQMKVPLVICMGGGYSPDIKDILEAHANTYRLAQEIFF